MDLTSSSRPSLTGVSNQSADLLHVTMTSSRPVTALTTAASVRDVMTEQGCVIVEAKPAVQNQPEQLVSEQVRFWTLMVTSAGLVPLLFVVGVPGNLLSAAVFCRQGLRERINLCIFCLALADIVVLTVTFCLAVEEVHTALVSPSYFFIVHFVGLTGFIRVSMFLSAVIAAERCFCVVSPLLAQRVLSTSTLAVLLTFVSLALLAGMQVAAGHKRQEVCTFDPLTNVTSTAVVHTDFFKDNRDILEPLGLLVYGTVLPVLFFGLVLITTIITALTLQSAHRWRQQSSSSSSSASSTHSTGTGSLEKNMVAVTRMLIATSVLFVVCFAPIPVVQIATILSPELKNGGQYQNLRNVLWKNINVLRCVNSSLNFFVYYRMGSRFRKTLRMMMMSCRGKGVGVRSDLHNSSKENGSSKCMGSTGHTETGANH